MANFANTLNPSSFGFYDSDPVYQNDADKVINFVLRKHAEPILSVELTKKMIWTCFEEATFTFNAQVVEYQAKSNLASLLGTQTGSIDPNDANTANLSINLTNNYIRPNLEFLIRQAEPYAAEIGYGQSKDSYSGSIDIAQGKQDYDLYTELKDSAGIALSSYMPTGSRGRMKVVEVYHFAPVQYIFNSNLASNFVASGLPIESIVPDTRFYILPLFEDLLRGSMLKEAQKTRRSHYRYKIMGRKLRIYPMPNNIIGGINNRIWVRVIFPDSPAPGIIGTQFSGSVGEGTGQDQALPDDSLYGVNSPANIPFGLINYASLNPWAKNWIFQYTLALCTELLGRVRNKFATIPIAGADLQLNGDALMTQGREDKERLLVSEGGLQMKLESLSYDKLMEIEVTKAKLQNEQLALLVMPPTCVISIK